ncbi:MAG TPA: MBL fold metallo-hydrolase [Myxococcales bacterium]|nr:MBL fold metallo-hydrolase [Myxococcales bacterium]
MGRFSHRAAEQRGPGHILKWKVLDPLSGRGPKADRSRFTPPARPFDAELVRGAAPSLTWIGHASFLLTLGGKKVVTDPVLGPRLEGFIRRFGAPGIPLEQMPEVDVVLVSHNHYDHLDAWSLKRLGPRPTYVVPLGNAGLVRGAGAREVVELDWWQSASVAGLEITLVPARHWSMRFPWNRNDMLWGGFVIRSPEGTAYHSGDTAHFDGFAEIGRRMGPVDWAMLPIGAYDPRWFMSAQHMNPEEAVDAAVQMNAGTMVAMHWGTFRLTDEPLAEPPVRARAEWERRGLSPDRLWILDIGESRALRPAPRREEVAP